MTKGKADLRSSGESVAAIGCGRLRGTHLHALLQMLEWVQGRHEPVRALRSEGYEAKR